jgi:hypothetical protein
MRRAGTKSLRSKGQKCRKTRTGVPRHPDPLGPLVEDTQPPHFKGRLRVGRERLGCHCDKERMPRFRMGKRRSKRTKAVVPVQFWITGSKEGHLAHTLDLTDDGVRLAGFRAELRVGDKIEIQYRKKRALFQVSWITTCEGSAEKHMGAKCLESGKQVWGKQFPQKPDEYEEAE